MKPLLSVVTVLYRSRAMLAETLPTWLRSAEGRPVEFVFVDNDPAGRCAELLPADCVYLPDPANPGFAAGCNRGVAKAGAPHVLLLNPDVWLAEDSLARILAELPELAERPAAVGLRMHGRAYAGIAFHPVSLFVDRPAGARRPPLGPSGGAAVFPVELYQRFGGFAERFFAWGEDADLAFRLTAAGVATVELDVVVEHASGHSVEGDRRLTERRAFLLARNRILVVARTFGGPLLALYAPVLLAAHLPLAARRAKQGLLRPFLRGVAAGVRTFRAARREASGRRLSIR